MSEGVFSNSHIIKENKPACSLLHIGKMMYTNYWWLYTADISRIHPIIFWKSSETYCTYSWQIQFIH